MLSLKQGKDGTLLPVQGLLQHQFQEFAAALEAFKVQGKVAIGAEQIVLHGVGAHIRVLGTLNVETGPGHGRLTDLQPVILAGEPRRVVIDVQHLHLHVVHLDGLLEDQLQAEEAGGAQLAERLSVHALPHQQRPAAQLQLQVLPAAARSDPRSPGRQPPRIHAQVTAHHRAGLGFLRHRVAVNHSDGKGHRL
uniref:Uncharacterized protein n=1 Tax=Serinus canaria TaxID=9135 RepID=A0A8C9N2J5_SERCA